MLGFLKKLFGSSPKVSLDEYIKEGAFIVDVRSMGEFRSGSAKGAVNIPLDEIESQISKFKSKKSVVVFCRSGMRSAQAKRILEKNGIENVYNGGSWQNVDRAIRKS